MWKVKPECRSREGCQDFYEQVACVSELANVSAKFLHIKCQVRLSQNLSEVHRSVMSFWHL